MFQRSEGHFKGFNKIGLFYQKWGLKSARANLIITHGQAEHSGCYQRLVQALEDININIYAWDLRGHGRSEGQRGYATDLEDYCRDYQIFLKKLTLEKEIMSHPLFLLGHSMGGLVQMKTLCEHPQLPITAQVLSSPMFGISVPVPPIKDKAARWINQLIPKLTLGNEISYSALTRDENVIKEFEFDTLRHDRISAGVYLGSLKAMSYVKATCTQVKSPTLLQISDADPVTSTVDAKEVFENIGSKDKVMKIYSDRKHEIYNDLDREVVFSDLSAFLKTHIN